MKKGEQVALLMALTAVVVGCYARLMADNKRLNSIIAEMVELNAGQERQIADLKAERNTLYKELDALRAKTRVRPSSWTGQYELPLIPPPPPSVNGTLIGWPQPRPYDPKRDGVDTPHPVPAKHK